MVKKEIRRIGIIGFGYIGSYLFEQITERPELGLEIAFVCDRSGNAISELPPEILILSAGEINPAEADIIIEAAHPEVVREHGERILGDGADFIPLSTTALAEKGLLERLESAASSGGSRLHIPHGAAVGLESLAECRELWEEVTVTMRKNPRNLDFSSTAKWRAESISEEALLYDGPTRGICPIFPRNVNAHAAVALYGIGFDRTRSLLYADPSLDVSVIEITARGQGVELHVERRNPLKGVSGVFTLRAALGALIKAAK